MLWDLRTLFFTLLVKNRMLLMASLISPVRKKWENHIVCFNSSSNPPIASFAETNVISSYKGKYQQQLGSKKKGKGKKKKYSSSQDKKTNKSSNEKWKPCYPLLIFNDEHITRNYPHHVKVNQFMKSSTSPVVLTDLFPNQEIHMASRNPSSFNIILMISSTNHKSNAMVATQIKDCGNTKPLNS